MKPRLLTASVLVLLLVLCWLWFRRGPANAAPSIETPDVAARSKSIRPSTPGGPVRGNNDHVAMARDLMEKANRPIQFFGIVLDQDDNPIPGVKVTLEIRVSKELNPNIIRDVFDAAVVTTGPDGRFALTDAKGALLGVRSLDKPGYEPSEKVFRKSYWYWRDPSQVFHPDPERPEIFRMWKRAGAEKLVRKGIGHAIPYDGTATSFDLLEGRVVASGGDLRVTLLRNPQTIQWGQRNYEWTLTIEAPDGGLIASSDEQMYRAPADGYQPRIVVHMSANDPNWTDRKDVALYMKLRGGKYYGRSELKLMAGADRPVTPFSITSFINPNGSHNLEYDPLQEVTAPARPNAPKH